MEVPPNFVIFIRNLFKSLIDKWPNVSLISNDNETLYINKNNMQLLFRYFCKIMRVMRKTWLFLVLVLSMVSLAVMYGCVSIPNLTNSPEITFKSIRFAKGRNSFTDTLYIGINFTDGDGNLGLNSTDTTGQFALIVNGSVNLNHYNFVVSPEIKYPKVGSWKPFVFPCVKPPCTNNYNGRFPPLFSNTVDQKPIKGTIVYNVPSLSYPYDSLMRFKVYIQDRSLNKSNTILTDSILIQ